MKNTLKNIINTWHDALYDEQYDNYFVFILILLSGTLLIKEITLLIIGVSMASWPLMGSNAGFIVGILISRYLIGDKTVLGVFIACILIAILAFGIFYYIIPPYPTIVNGIIAFFICVIPFIVVSYTIKHGSLRKES